MGRSPDGSPGEGVADAPTGGERGPGARSLDAVFEVLMGRRRRYALYVLSRTDGPTALPDLAAEVASLQNADRDRVTVSLYHVHLPKLADAGVVDYDAEAGTVELADSSDRLREYLAVAAANERPALRRALDDLADAEC